MYTYIIYFQINLITIYPTCIGQEVLITIQIKKIAREFIHGRIDGSNSKQVPPNSHYTHNIQQQFLNKTQRKHKVKKS